MPYNVKKVDIEEHFKKIPPSSIRLAQNKDTGKCRGFAFLEWASWDKLQTAFQLYHHTEISTDGGKTTRKINVEIT
jgi:nucleolar protein 6